MTEMSKSVTSRLYSAPHLVDQRLSFLGDSVPDGLGALGTPGQTTEREIKVARVTCQRVASLVLLYRAEDLQDQHLGDKGQQERVVSIRSQVMVIYKE